MERRENLLTHGRSKKYECQKPWQQVCEDGAENYKFKTTESWTDSVRNWIEANIASNLSRFKPTPKSATHSVTKRAIKVVAIEEADTPEIIDPEMDGRKKKKAKEDIEVRAIEIKSQGHSFEIIGVPNTHVLIHKNKLERLKNVDDKVKTMEGPLEGERLMNNVGRYTKTLLGVGLSSAPSLPLSQAAHIMPLFVGAFLANFGLIDKAKVDRFSKCFPSEAYLRDLMYNMAAENLLELGDKLKGKQVFLSCDKGSKKGVGHFVKILSWFDDGRVRKQCLDIDSSEGTTEQCANAIRASLKKVSLLKLQGQTTDSGGGGVLDGLIGECFGKSCALQHQLPCCLLLTAQLATVHCKASEGHDGQRWAGKEECHAAPSLGLRFTRQHEPRCMEACCRRG